MAKRERGQTGDPDSIHGGWEVRGDWQGCILEPRRRNGSRGGEGGKKRRTWRHWLLMFCGQGLGSERRKRKARRAETEEERA